MTTATTGRQFRVARPVVGQESDAATGRAFKTSVFHIVQVDDTGPVVPFRNYINTAWTTEAFLGERPYTVLASA